jgi:hypothetical protein
MNFAEVIDCTCLEKITMSKETVFQLVVQGVSEREPLRARDVSAHACETLWMDERSRQRLLEAFGQLTIGDLLDGII